MAKESQRKCTYCGLNGHNSRTCTEVKGGGGGGGGGVGGFRLFGVEINLKAKEGISSGNNNNVNEIGRRKGEEAMRKSKSLGNLQGIDGKHNVEQTFASPVDDGYHSDCLIQTKSARTTSDRKKGIPWTEEEHRAFLDGLDKLGKGDWRGISKSFVPSRTPTQVASHAQKHFIRKASTEKKRRRSSLFDMPLHESASTSASAANSVRPPICPVSSRPPPPPPPSPPSPPRGISEFHHIPFMATSTGQVFPLASVMLPTTSYGGLPHRSGDYGSCTPFFPQPLPVFLPLQSSAATPPTQLPRRDNLELSIRALEI